jgi:hypothetical protein
LNGIQGFTLNLFTKVLGWSTDEVEVLVAQCRKVFQDRSIHAYQKV